MNRDTVDSLLETVGKSGLLAFEFLAFGIGSIILSFFFFELDKALFPYAHNVLTTTVGYIACLASIAFAAGAVIMIAFTLLLLVICFIVWILVNIKNSLYKKARK